MLKLKSSNRSNAEIEVPKSRGRIQLSKVLAIKKSFQQFHAIIETVTKNLTQIQKHVYGKKSTILLQIS